MTDPVLEQAAAPRDPATRKADALALLTTPAVDAWVASAGPHGSSNGGAHLVPLSLCWTDGRAVIALDPSSVTGRNLTPGASARLAVGPTRDVVMIDGVVERVVPVEAAPDLGAAYAAQADWDPRRSEGYHFVVLRPVRIQAWREADEIAGRTLMRAGTWLT